MRSFRSVGFQKTGQRVYRSARRVANHKCRSRSISVPILVCGYAFALSMSQLGYLGCFNLLNSEELRRCRVSSKRER